MITSKRNAGSVRRGVSATESAVFLAVIVCTLAGVGWGVGQLVEKKLARTSVAVGCRPHSTMMHTATEQLQIQEDSGAMSNWGWPLAWMALGLGAAAVVGYTWYYHRRRATVHEGMDVDAENAEVIAPATRRCIFAKRQATLAILNNQLGMAGFGAMQAQHLMSKDVQCVSSATSIADVRELMAQGVRHLLVSDDGARLCGVISDRDLAKASTGTAEDIMTPNPVTAAPDAPISGIVTMMMRRRISCVPIITNSSIAGILTTTDLMIALQCTLQVIHSIGEAVESN